MKRLTTARRIAVEDAIFSGKMALLKRRELLANLQSQEDFVAYKEQYFEALETLQKQLSISKTRAIRLLDGKLDFEELAIKEKAVIGDA